MKNAILCHIGKRQKKNTSSALFNRLAQRSVSLILRDLIPTLVILLMVGWLSLQVAAQIADTKENRQESPASVAAKR